MASEIEKSLLFWWIQKHLENKSQNGFELK